MSYDPRPQLLPLWRPTLFAQQGTAYEREGEWFVKLQQLAPNWVGYVKEVRIDDLDSDQDRCPLCGDTLQNDMTCDDHDQCYLWPFCSACDWSPVHDGGVPIQCYQTEEP